MLIETATLAPADAKASVRKRRQRQTRLPAQVTVTVAPPLTLAPPVLTNNTIALSWNAFADWHYQIQSATNSPSGPWQNLGGVLTATGITASVLLNTGSDPQRFYRVVVSP